MSQDEFKLQNQSADQTQGQKQGLLRNSLGNQQLYDSASSTSSDSPSVTGERWITLCEYFEVEQDGMYSFEVPKGEESYPILLINKEKQLYALHDECPHRRLKISSQGYIDDEHVYCGFHHWGFKIDSGAHLLPTGICVDHYAVKIESGQVLINISW